MNPVPASAHFYFQCCDSTELVLVERRLFTTEGTLAASSWFSYTFSGRMKAPEPLRFHHDAGEGETAAKPVYYLPMPRLVLLELLQLMYFAPLRATALDKVPLSLKNVLSLEAWQEYVTYYGLDVRPDKKRKADAEAQKEEACAKKRRLEEKILAGLESLPLFQFIKRVAEALADHITRYHPRWDTFRAGANPTLLCDFINTYAKDGDDGDLTFLLDLPGEPVVPPVKPAWLVGLSLAHGWGRYKFMTLDNKPTAAYFCHCFEQHLQHAYRVSYSMVTKRTSKAKKPIALQYWPTGHVEITPGLHDVMRLTLRHADKPGPLDEPVESAHSSSGSESSDGEADNESQSDE